MRLLADDRGVTVQIGAVLLFAVLVVLMSGYQAQIVPQQNEAVEFNHNQQVHGQLQNLRSAIVQASTTGTGMSVSVPLGTTYAERAFFVNPPPPAGSVRTTPPAEMTVGNATADGETGDYWNGSDQRFSTLGIVYDPSYHEYQNPPETVYRSSVLHNRFPGANVTLSGQQLVRGNRITLVAMDGSLSEDSSGTVSIDPRAVSAATRSVTVRNESADENVTLVVPTTLSVSTWEDLLADQIDETGDESDEYVQAVEAVDGRDAVRVVLEPDTYVLRLAKVGIGSGVSGVGAHYVTDVQGDNTSVPEDSSRELVVEVRDRFDNPVTGTTVNATLVGGAPNDAIATAGASGQTLTDLKTDGEGHVTIRYEAAPDFDGSNREATVRISTSRVPATGDSFDPDTRANLSFNLTVVNTDGSGFGGGGGSDGAYQTLWNVSSIATEPGMNCYANDTCRYDRSAGESVTLTAETIPIADDARIDFAVNDTSVATFNVSDRRTNRVGQAQVDLDTDTTDNVTVYTWSGGSGDALTVDIYDTGDGLPGGLRYNDDGQAVDSPTDDGTTESSLTFSVTNQFNQQLTITDLEVNPQAGLVNRLNDPSSQEGKWNSELYVEADGQNGITDIPGGTDLPSTIDIDADGHSGASTEPVLSSGSDATFYLYKFQQQIGFFGSNDVDMNGQPVEFTVQYELADGTTGTATFTVVPA